MRHRSDFVLVPSLASFHPYSMFRLLAFIPLFLCSSSPCIASIRIGSGLTPYGLFTFPRLPISFDLVKILMASRPFVCKGLRLSLVMPVDELTLSLFFLLLRDFPLSETPARHQTQIHQTPDNYDIGLRRRQRCQPSLRLSSSLAFSLPLLSFLSSTLPSSLSLTLPL